MDRIKNWHIVLGALVLVLIALGVSACFWPDVAKVQAVGGIAGFVATVFLLALTAVYVRTNQESLSLMRAQWDQSHEVALRFGVKIIREFGNVWIVNAGLAQTYISKVVVRKHDGPTTTLLKHTVLQPGGRRSFPLPVEIWRDCSPVCDIEVSIEYEHFGKPGKTPGKAYSLMPSWQRPTTLAGVERGVGGLWGVSCPKCNTWPPGMYMRTEGLLDFAEAESRQHAMEKELSDNCPQHSSQWMLTVDSPKSDARGEE